MRDRFIPLEGDVRGYLPYFDRTNARLIAEYLQEHGATPYINLSQGEEFNFGIAADFPEEDKREGLIGQLREQRFIYVSRVDFRVLEKPRLEPTAHFELEVDPFTAILLHKRDINLDLYSHTDFELYKKH